MLSHILVFVALLAQLGKVLRVKKTSRRWARASPRQYRKQPRLSEESPHTCEDVCADEIEYFSLAESERFSQLWNKYDISHVGSWSGSWSASNHQHCEVALMLHTACRKDTCLASCNRDLLNEDIWERTCADLWQSDYNRFARATRMNLKKKNELHHIIEHYDLWFDKVSQTVPPCEVCSVHNEDEGGVPDACQKEYNVDDQVSKLLQQNHNITEGSTESSSPRASSSGTNVASDRTSTSGKPFSAELTVYVEEKCTRKCSKVARELDELVSALATTHPDVRNFYDSFGLTWLKSWHFLSKLHCHAALAKLKWCERDACYWKCQAKYSSRTNKTSAADCEQAWGSDYHEGFQSVREKMFEILRRRNIPMGNAKRWWGDIVRTLETCNPCADDLHIEPLPKSCWNAYNIYTEVWFDTLPENADPRIGAKRQGVFRRILGSVLFYCALVVVVLIACGCYWL